VNYGGTLGKPENTPSLINEAVSLAKKLGARYLELRHETPVEHPALTQAVTDKVHMRLLLPDTVEALWKSLSPKVRNQIRKSEKLGLVVEWGREECLTDFYRVFCHNMRDLGTPVFPQKLFAGILRAFPEAEIAVVRFKHRALAAGIVLHGSGVTEVPSASSLRKWNWTCANMGLYWAMLQRSVERGQKEFDFGRSTLESSTYRFKKQWGAQPYPAHWQYHVFRGTACDLRPDNPRFRLATAVWRRLPVWLTRCLGPWIVKGIP
jgi:FemAB-related protein (PEP-CTERM system-associated)